MMLRASNLAIGYQNRALGDNISLSISAGQSLCLLGPNGCGKTTLFKTLLGLIPPVSGSLQFAGADIATIDRPAFARRVAYVPQAQPATFPFKVTDMVLMGRASRVGAFATPSASDRAICDAALRTLGIEHLAQRLFTEISGGERQMVLIARALAQEPVLIVMDEPTASLDFGNQARVLAQVRLLSRQGLAIVFSTHDPGQAFACADQVALMKQGQIVAMGAPDGVITPGALQHLYGVGVAVAYLDEIGRRICAPTLDTVAEDHTASRPTGVD